MKKAIQILRHADVANLPATEIPLMEGIASFYGDHEDMLCDSHLNGAFRSGFRSDFFLVVHVRSGTLHLRIDFNDYYAQKDTLIIAGANSVKQLISFSSDCIVSGLSFTIDFLTRIKLQENIVDIMEFFTARYIPLWQLTTEESKLLTESLSRIEQRQLAKTNHSFGKELLINSFTDLLYEIGNIWQQYTDGLTFGRKEELVIRFIRLAMEHHLHERRLSFYSNKLFVSAKHLSETVKEITGKTAGIVIDEMNIMEAKRLLEETELDISEIAFRLSFSNPAFFSKFFNRLSGTSPRAYRKKHKAGHYP